MKDADCLLFMLLNHSKTAAVFLQRFTPVADTVFCTIFSRICLLLVCFLLSQLNKELDRKISLGLYRDDGLAVAHGTAQEIEITMEQIRKTFDKRTLTNDAAATLINSQVTSKLDSFNAVLTGLSTPLLNKLQKVQNSAARLLTGTKKYDHITPVLKKLHWLPVKSRIDYKMLLLCFKALHDLAPKYLCDMIRKKKPAQELRPSSIRELEVPPSKTKTYRSSSLYPFGMWTKVQFLGCDGELSF